MLAFSSKSHCVPSINTAWCLQEDSEEAEQDDQSLPVPDVCESLISNLRFDFSFTWSDTVALKSYRGSISPKDSRGRLMASSDLDHLVAWTERLNEERSLLSFSADGRSEAKSRSLVLLSCSKKRIKSNSVSGKSGYCWKIKEAGHVKKSALSK